MFVPILISLSVIIVTIFIHGLGTFLGLKFLFKKHRNRTSPYTFPKGIQLLSITAVYLMILHYLEIAVWAIVYLWIPELEKLGTWEESIYFSMVTYATLGYGDITLPPVWRILSGFEAMNGILLFGWSTAMFYAVAQRIISRE